jgi:hypothetical protein
MWCVLAIVQICYQERYIATQLVHDSDNNAAFIFLADNVATGAILEMRLIPGGFQRRIRVAFGEPQSRVVHGRLTSNDYTLAHLLCPVSTQIFVLVGVLLILVVGECRYRTRSGLRWSRGWTSDAPRRVAMHYL